MYKKYELSDIVKIKYGKNQKKVVSELGDIPIYGTGGLMGYATKYLYNKPSVLIGRKGSIGKVKYVEHPFWTVDTLFYSEVNAEIVIPRYLFYKMSLIDLNIYNEGTTIPSLRTETLNRLTFKIPSIEEQLKTLKIIKPIDDKIELNNKINKNLEEMAQAIFKSWFVDFEPWGGEMPEEWGKIPLDKFCNIFTGKKNANASVSDGKYKFFTCSPKPLQINTYIFEGDAIIISGNGSYTGRTRFYCGKFDLYQRTYACVAKSKMPKDFIFTLFWYLKFDLSKKIMGGTHGSAIPYIVMNDIAKFELNYNEKFFKISSQIFKTITKTIQQNEKENEKLSNLRDTLLPKLMSGELDVSNFDI